MATEITKLSGLFVGLTADLTERFRRLAEKDRAAGDQGGAARTRRATGGVGAGALTDC
jgi:hypothetical protein